MTTVIDQAALDSLLFDLSGPVMRACYEQSERVKEVASDKVPRSEGPGPHLADSGLVEDTLGSTGRPAFLVGFDSDHAGFYFFGTRPHIIRPKSPGGVLAFRWPKVGPGMFFFRSVQSPGTSPHPFLLEAAAEVFGVSGIG